MDYSSLQAISPLDGRYAEKIEKLKPIFSEYGLMRHRILIEIKWFEMLSNHTLFDVLPELSAETTQILYTLYDDFSLADAEQIKSIESITNHDVKAIEYFIKEKFKTHETLRPYREFVHFACTSEDINNLAYALMLKAGCKVLMNEVHHIAMNLKDLAHQYAEQPMLSRTHGQTATPTTLGKEIANVVYRLNRQIKQLKSIPILGKINGAVGNYNAHHVAYSNIDWIKLTQDFIETLALSYNPYTTQIEPHDMLSEHFDIIRRINVILIDFNRDIWGYISLGYFKQKINPNEIGSSTMPHKVNPIDFENSEGNLHVANALLTTLSEKLPTSRWQRDLTDSTLLRNIGPLFSHSLISYLSTLKGIHKLEANIKRIDEDLDQAWEVLAEPVQVVMRQYNLPSPYEQLKQLSRGKKLTQTILHQFIQTLNLPSQEKIKLLALTPRTYIGYADQLAKTIQVSS
ncbi:MAG: adenylosuccinate lyase [Endozoicomonadaceae bacterium]|nr:adenylosuccinate lyase [Endozoicomonadaceae bacterium]